MAKPKLDKLMERVMDLEEMEKDKLIDLVLEQDAELAKYKAAAVVGGDGEPIGIGDMVAAVGWVKPPEEHQRKVVKTKSDTTGKWIDVGFGWHEADRFFIVSPAVPEGG